jgi:hypothetical protein
VGVATALPGRLALVADHLVLALREPGSGEDASFVLSWYSVAYSADAPGGNLAFLRSSAAPGGEAILTDAPGLDQLRRGRLRPRSWPLARPDADAIAATFDRTPIRDGALEAEIIATGLRVEIAWRRLGPPIVAAGQVGADPPWDSSTVLMEAGAWSVSINGRSIHGAPFPNDVWRPWLDRPLSSALVALAEVFREVDEIA